MRERVEPATQYAWIVNAAAMLLVGGLAGYILALQGRHREAQDAFRRELEFVARVDHALRGRISIELNQRLGGSYLALGETAPAAAAFTAALTGWEERVRMGADDPFTRYYAAAVYALQGQTEPALANLEKAARARRAFVVERARIEPEFESLRGESRFEALTAR